MADDRLGELHAESIGAPPPRVLPCLVCGGELERVAPRDIVPLGAVTFTSRGQYGSSAFDPMDAYQSLAVNVCDGCLTTAGEQGRVNLLTYPDERPQPGVRQWPTVRAPR
jgi:hypothetical protein